MEEKEITIFYSWQSDLPAETNKDAIEQALQEAKTNLTNQYKDYIIVIDDATRETAGSKSIKDSIFEKISNCDIFVCDVSLINYEDVNKYQKKPLPNSNVLIELGFAIAKLGWERILLVYNLHYCKKIKLPFDIAQNEVIDFSIKKKEEGNYLDSLSRLSKKLEKKLSIIIKQNPTKAFSLLNFKTDAEIRKRDIETIILILRSIHFKSFDNFFNCFPHSFKTSVLNCLDALEELQASSTFHIYDNNLKMKFYEFLESFLIILSGNNRHHYELRENNNEYIYIRDHSKDQTQNYNALLGQIVALKYEYFDFLNYIKENYIEVDFASLEKYQNENTN